MRVRVSPSYIYAIVIGLCASTASVAAFKAALEAVISAGVDSVRKGKVLIGTGSGGTTVQYTLPSIGSYTAEDVIAAYVLLHREVEALIEATPGITKEQLCAALKGRKRGTNRVLYAMGGAA